MGSVVRTISKPFESIVKKAATTVGLRSDQDLTINQDPNTIKSQALAANLGVDLANDNTPTVQSGGEVSSASDTLSKRRRTTSGVSSGLGIGV